jgi:hypothetical protein
MRNSIYTRLLCAIALAGALVAFSGCGGSDNKSSSSSSNTTATAGGGNSGAGSLADYKAGVTKAGQDFKNAAQAASSKVQNGATVQDKLAGFDELKKSVTTAADSFQQLNPPANLKADNSKLVTELRDLGSSIGDVQTALKNKDRAQAAAVLQRLAKAQTDISTTLGRIQAKLGG